MEMVSEISMSAILWKVAIGITLFFIAFSIVTFVIGRVKRRAKSRGKK